MIVFTQIIDKNKQKIKKNVFNLTVQYHEKLLLFSHYVTSSSLLPHKLLSTRLLCPCDFPGKSTRMCCDFLLKGIFPTQGQNLNLLLHLLLHLLHFRQILYCWATGEAHHEKYSSTRKKKKKTPKNWQLLFGVGRGGGRWQS